MALVKAGAGLDPQAAPSGDHTLVKVIVPVTVAERTGTRPQGFSVIESTGTTVASGTAEAALCDGGWQEVVLDECGNPLDAGRTRRLFGRRQREALAVRDGGCMWPDCLQPPAFTQAHHIEQWKRDRGRTDLANGLLLCRFHHLLLHDHHWKLCRNADGRFWLTPPASVDRDRVAIRLESKNLLVRERQRERGPNRRPDEVAVGSSVALLI